jgi:tetratricopeptide (TPR) repeat protein
MRTAPGALLLALTFTAGCISPEDSTGDTSGEDAPVVTDSLTWLNDQILAAPLNPDGYAQRAEYNLRKGEVGAAMDDLALVVQADSTRIEERHTLGELRFDVRDFEGAVREWEGILRTDAQYAPALLSLARVDVLLRAYDPAMKRINAALQVDDRLDEAYFLKGRLYLETEDTIKAASSFQTAAEVNPDRYDAFIQLGLLYAAAHDDLALEYFRTARSLRPNSIEALYDEAIYLQEHARKDTSRYRQALTLYDRILELDGANASAAFNKGFIHLEHLADYSSAERWFDEAIARLPYYHQAHYNRGLAIESQGRDQDALEAYDAALTIDPTYTPAAIAKGRVLGR